MQHVVLAADQPGQVGIDFTTSRHPSTVCGASAGRLSPAASVDGATLSTDAIAGSPP
jgi:hypothetical protein